MQEDRFDRFLYLASKNLEELFGFESWVIFLINHNMKAIFTIEFNHYEESLQWENEKEERWEQLLIKNNASLQQNVSSQKQNMIKLLLGVGLTCKSLKSRKCLIFKDPEKEEDFAQEVDRIKVRTRLLIIFRFQVDSRIC